MSRQSHCAGLQLCGNRHGALPSTMASQVTVLPRSSDEFARIEYLLQVRSLPLDKIIPSCTLSGGGHERSGFGVVLQRSHACA